MALGLGSAHAVTPDAATRQTIEQATLQAFERHYVLPERLRELPQRLAAQRTQLDAAADGPAYAQQLGQLLAQATRDKHVRVVYSPQPMPAELAPTQGSAEQERQMNRFINQGVHKVERLPGNIGLLDLRAFTGRDQSRAKLDAAMALLADTDALIIDLRANGGGSPETVAHLSSYFFKERTHLNDMVWRTERGEEVDSYHSETMAFHYDKPVWLLMSARSVSAAEGFAYNLQQHKRAQVAGQTSMGAAHAGGMHRIGTHFSVFVPSGRSRSPKTRGQLGGGGRATRPARAGWRRSTASGAAAVAGRLQAAGARPAHAAWPGGAYSRAAGGRPQALSLGVGRPRAVCAGHKLAASLDGLGQHGQPMMREPTLTPILRSLRATGAVLALGVTVFLAAPLAQAQRTVMVGHSLINHDMPTMLAHLAQRAGLPWEQALQVINGASLKVNWSQCRAAQFTGDHPPAAFACDVLEQAAVPFDTLVLTDANNTIRSNHLFNHPQQHVAQFAELLLRRQPQGRMFLYTAWERLDRHGFEWPQALDAELAEYRQIATEAEQIAAQQGRVLKVEVLPVNRVLGDLIVRIEAGQIPGLSQRTDLFMDPVHLNDLGNYLVANTVLARLTGRSPVGLVPEVKKPWAPVRSLDASQVAALQAQIAQSLAETDLRAQAGGEVPGLRVSVLPDTRGLRLSWDAPPVGVRSLRVLLNGRGLHPMDAEQRSLDLHWLDPSRPLALQLEGRDAAGQRVAVSTLRGASVGDTQPPTAPGALTLQRSASQVVLGWQPSFDNQRVAKYLVQRGGEALGTVLQPGFTDPWPRQAPARYCVQAVDGQGNRSALSCIEG